MIDTKSLRKNLLSLAVTGKLTEQSEKDTPLSDDLNEYIPKMDIELPEIPMNWKYCKFDMVLINRDSERIPVSVADRKKLDKVYDYYGASGVIDKVDSYLFDETLLLIGEDGANLLSRSTPIAFLAHGKYWVNNHAHVLAPTEHILLEYAEIAINSMSLVPFVTGAAQPKLSQNMMNKIAIPVPPLEEQQRIVDVVKESFKILDTIDELQRTYLSDVEVLKSKLIDAGIQGKLTEQLSEDGTAEELFVEIQTEKRQLIKEKKIKMEKALSDISEEEIPFEIPNNWKWVRWGELSQSIQYGYNAPAKQEGRIKMVRISDIQDGKVLWDTVPYCDIDETEIESYLLHENDILFARTGGTVGKSYIVADVPEEAVFAGYLIRTSYSSKLFARYMKYFMESKLYWRQLQNGTIATAQPNCNGQTLSKMVLPLPPYAEQVRIVEKLDALLGLI